MLLGPLKRSFRRHGAYLLQLPSKAVRPGALLSSEGALFQDLLEVDALWNGRNARLGKKASAHFLLDKSSYSIKVGGNFGVGLPQIGSVKAMAKVSQQMHLEIHGISTRRVRVDHKTEHAADWLIRLNEHLDCTELEPALPLLKRRQAYVPWWRDLDLVEATVHVERLSFKSNDKGAIALSGEIEKALPVDLRAGFDMSWSDEGSLSWKAGDIPIGYLPVRYAWSESEGRFVAAKV